MSLAKELDKLKYDKRLLDWHVNRGFLSKEDRKKHLDSLPDLASNVEPFGLGNEVDELDEVDQVDEAGAEHSQRSN
jgi:hypothetical protein